MAFHAALDIHDTEDNGENNECLNTGKWYVWNVRNSTKCLLFAKNVEKLRRIFWLQTWAMEDGRETSTKRKWKWTAANYGSNRAQTEEKCQQSSSEKLYTKLVEGFAEYLNDGKRKERTKLCIVCSANYEHQPEWCVRRWKAWLFGLLFGLFGLLR